MCQSRSHRSFFLLNELKPSETSSTTLETGCQSYLQKLILCGLGGPQNCVAVGPELLVCLSFR